MNSFNFNKIANPALFLLFAGGAINLIADSLPAEGEQQNDLSLFIDSFSYFYADSQSSQIFCVKKAAYLDRQAQPFIFSQIFKDGAIQTITGSCAKIGNRLKLSLDKVYEHSIFKDTVIPAKPSGPIWFDNYHVTRQNNLVIGERIFINLPDFIDSLDTANPYHQKWIGKFLTYTMLSSQARFQGFGDPQTMLRVAAFGADPVAGLFGEGSFLVKVSTGFRLSDLTITAETQIAYKNYSDFFGITINGKQESRVETMQAHGVMSGTVFILLKGRTKNFTIKSYQKMEIKNGAPAGSGFYTFSTGSNRWTMTPYEMNNSISLPGF